MNPTSSPYVYTPSQQELRDLADNIFKNYSPSAVTQPLYPELMVKKRKPQGERELSVDELLHLFDRKESLCNVYVPHFMTQAIMYYLDQLCSYARANRIGSLKRYVHKLQSLRDEYVVALKHEMPYDIYQKFLRQREDFLNFIAYNLQITYFTFCNELVKQNGSVSDDCIYSYAMIMREMVRYVDRFDAEVNRKIAEKLKTPCRNHGDARLSEIRQTCDALLHDLKTEPSQQTDLAIQVIVTKAKTTIHEMDCTPNE